MTDALDIATKDLSLNEKIKALLVSAKDIKPIECEEKHHFGPSLYIKEVTMPAGSVIVGKPHKVEHMCIMLSGKMILVNEQGERKELTAPMTFMAKPGRKVAYIIETVVFQNVYATDETDIEKLENMFVDNSQQLLEEK